MDSHRLSQSQVSSVVLLLVTCFKAILTASVGMCFAQHLWLILRGRETSISLIEKLFTSRTNALALFDPRVIARAPLLFLMALYVWCIGIAMIYPPGSLTVASVPHVSTHFRELLVVSPPSAPENTPGLFGNGDLWPTLARLVWGASGPFLIGKNTSMQIQYR